MRRPSLVALSLWMLSVTFALTGISYFVPMGMGWNSDLILAGNVFGAGKLWGHEFSGIQIEFGQISIGRWGWEYLRDLSGNDSIVKKTHRVADPQSRPHHYRRTGSNWENSWNEGVIIPLWIPAIIFALPLATMVIQQRLIQRHRDPTKCRQCGYDLRATPERCPECGAVPTPMSTA